MPICHHVYFSRNRIGCSKISVSHRVSDFKEFPNALAVFEYQSGTDLGSLSARCISFHVKFCYKPMNKNKAYFPPDSVSAGVPGAHGGIGAPPHLLSSSPCSSPFQVCALGPNDYTCSRPSHPLHRYSNPPEPFPSPRGPPVYDSEGLCSLPLSTTQLGYLSNPTHQGYAGLRLHTPPYSLYGYTFPSSPRLAASPEKMAAAATATHQSHFLGTSPSGTLTDSLGVLGGGQQGFLFDSRTLGLAGSQPGGGASQVTAHMG